MGRVSVSEEIRKMRFTDVMGRYSEGRLTCEDAADILGMSLSSFYRWRQRFEAKGLEGLADGRLGKLSARRVPVDVVTQVLGLFTTRYFDFNVRHFHENLVHEHGFKCSYTWTKNTFQAAGVIRHEIRTP